MLLLVLATGTPLSETVTTKHRRRLLESMQGKGRLMPGFVLTEDGPVKGVIQPVALTKQPKFKKGEVKTASEPVYVQPAPIIPSVVAREEKVEKPGFTVTFVIDSGKIKTTCDAVLENEYSLLLVYKNEDAISYLPDKASELAIITPDKREIPVLYLGLQFEWYESRQQLLLFMKTEVKE